MANNPLFDAAYNGRIDDLISLLSQPDVELNILNSTGSTALTGAAEQGRVEAVRLLLENGAATDIVNHHGMTAMSYAKQHGHKQVIELLNNPPPLKRLYETPDQVVFSSLVSNRTLEEVFNFVSFERISLIRNGRSGPVEAFTREPFAVLEDEGGLRKAFAEHVRRGGTVPEEKVFPHRLQKNKIPRS